jgi:hypothetical protein
MPDPVIPKSLLILTIAYFAASLAHFGHNAEYIAFYPGMPAWLTREKVYLAWLAVTGVGCAAWVLARLALPAPALLLLAVYGALGLDGLAHYTLGLCSEHTLMANLTIGSEAVTGMALLLTCVTLFVRRLASHRAAGMGLFSSLPLVGEGRRRESQP